MINSPRHELADLHSPNAGFASPDQSKARLCRLSDMIGELRSDADAANRSHISGVPRAAISGLSSLDHELSGAFVPGVHFVHGNAGTGKTALCLQIAANCGCPSMFVTCEMAPVELLRRHTARVTRTPLSRLKNGEISGKQVEELAYAACEVAPHLAFVDATMGPATANFLCECAQIMMGNGSRLLIVIDSLQSWVQGIGGDMPEYEALNAGVNSLQRLSHLTGSPILVISERNRDSMKSGGINAGAGTRKIEYGAETVIDLEREVGQVEDGAGEVAIKLTLVKNRHGTAGKPVPLKFHGALQQYREAKKP